MIKKQSHVTHPHHATSKDSAYEEWLSHTSTYPTEDELESMDASLSLFPPVPIPVNSINYNPNDQGA